VLKQVEKSLDFCLTLHSGSLDFLDLPSLHIEQAMEESTSGFLQLNEAVDGYLHVQIARFAPQSSDE